MCKNAAAAAAALYTFFDSCNFSGTWHPDSIQINKFNVTTTIFTVVSVYALQKNGSVKAFKKGIYKPRYRTKFMPFFNAKQNVIDKFSLWMHKIWWNKKYTKRGKNDGTVVSHIDIYLDDYYIKSTIIVYTYSINDNLLCINNFHKRAIFPWNLTALTAKSAFRYEVIEFKVFQIK